MNRTIIAEAAAAWVAANDHAHCRYRHGTGRTAFGRDTFPGPSADDILAAHGIDHTDPIRYRQYEAAVFERACALLGREAGDQRGKHGNQWDR